MSKSKYTNLICMVIICLTVLVTVLFMYEGSKRAVSVSSSDISKDSYFSQKDMDGSWSEEEATYIALGDTTEIDGSGASYENGKLYIALPGTYVFSGEQTGIQIVVNARNGEVQLVFDGVNISGTGEPAIYAEDASHVYLTLAEGSENTVSLTEEWSDESVAEDLDAVIYSKCSLTVNGAGNLTVSSSGTQKQGETLNEDSDKALDEDSNEDLDKALDEDSDKALDEDSDTDSDMTESRAHGIKSTDDLIITGGVICVNVSGNALAGRDSVRVCGGTFDLTAGNDGIKSNNDNDEDKGYILITDGTFTIVSARDGIQAETNLLIEGGTFDITAGGGSGNVSAIQSDSAGIIPNGGIDPGNAGIGGMDFAGDMSDAGSNEDMDISDGPGGMPDMNGEPGDMPDMNGEMGSMPGGARDLEDAGASGEAPDTEASDGADISQGTKEFQETREFQGTKDFQETEDDSCKGLKAGVSMTICGGTFDVDCADDAVHSNGTITISGGTFLLASGDDGVHADDTLLVEGGEVTVTTSYEGLEAEQIQITDGNIDITASDDGINASNGSGMLGFGMGSMPGGISDTEDKADTPDTKNTIDTGDAADSSLPVLCITGGTIHVDAGGDGLDSNGDLIVEGGLIYVDGPTNSGNGSLDFGSESGGDCVVHGGTVLALGASGMEENFSDNSEQTFIHCDFTSDFSEGDELKIIDAQGEILFEYTVNKSGNCVIFSSPELSEGEIYTVLVGEQSEEAAAGDNASSNGMGMQNFRR